MAIEMTSEVRREMLRIILGEGGADIIVYKNDDIVFRSPVVISANGESIISARRCDCSSVVTRWELRGSDGALRSAGAMNGILPLDGTTIVDFE